MVMEGDLTWGGEHTRQYTGDMLQNCTPDLCNFINRNNACEIKSKVVLQIPSFGVKSTQENFPKVLLIQSSAKHGPNNCRRVSFLGEEWEVKPYNQAFKFFPPLSLTFE